MRKVADRVIDAVARRAEAAREAGSSHLEVFRGLWNSDRNRQRHLEKRLREGSVEDEAGYLEKNLRRSGGGANSYDCGALRQAVDFGKSGVGHRAMGRATK